jgi:flagellar motility protein MotE (MotC chaperone)
MSRYFTKPNLFTPLIVASAFAFAFRLTNIFAHPHTPPDQVGIIVSAAAVEGPQASKEEPPPISQADVGKAVKETAKAADEGKANEGADGGKKEEGADAKTVDAKDAKPAGAAPVVPDASPAFSTSEIEVLQSLAKRRDELDTREKSLGQREALLKAAEGEVDNKITQLTKLKADMEKLLGQQQKEEEGRIASLVKIYENMKPSDAANIFNKLDMNILLDVVGRMNERKVSPILAGMDPEKAKDVTIKLAEQRRLPAAGKEAVAAKPVIPPK